VVSDPDLCARLKNVTSPYTGGSALIEALNDAGITHLFVNYGSDHPAIMEALAYAKKTSKPAPRVITCPNEMVALSCAQGFTQLTGKPQAVIIHVDCGTGAGRRHSQRGQVPRAGAHPCGAPHT
jgi:acetolactate synthase-1/2/3 large subunit